MSMQPQLWEEEESITLGQSVECLGITFDSDQARRAYFLDKLRAKLQDPEFRSTEGFPNGSDEDILALSDPPYYTACPNPFLQDFVRCYGNPYTPDIPYSREPFATDVSEGKSDAIYSAHTYHTKVPHKAIMRYILHYTQPGDIVLDGFCGTGMTGVAAQLCGNPDEETRIELEQEWSSSGQGVPKWGVRRAILGDLSPAAAFIAYNYNTPVDVLAFERAARRLLEKFEAQYGWMYQTSHNNGAAEGRINYVVWSDIFLCNFCQGEITFWTEAVEDGEMKAQIRCPHCAAVVSRTSLDRASTMMFDPVVGKPVTKARRVPVLINYSVGTTRFEKVPDAEDMALLQTIEQTPIPGWYPTQRIDGNLDLWFERDYKSLGIYSVDAFFTKRSLIMVSFFRKEISNSHGRLRGFLWFWFQSVLMGFTLLNRYLKNAFSQVNRILSGTLYVGAMQSEVSPWYALSGKIKRLQQFGYIKQAAALVTTGSTQAIDVPEASVDYIFTDPPFGSNIIYSDLSIVWEAWLGISTNTRQEAVVHRRKKEGAFTLEDYTRLLSGCFASMYRALKPGRWVTVEFHNSKNSVWNAIQEALFSAGFVVADVRTLDKQMGSFKQVSAAGAVKQDLVISAYKPNGGLEERFILEAGSEAGVWDFVHTHLRQLPIFVIKGGKVEALAERQNYLLYDRMVAFHVQRSVLVPLSAAEFYAGLSQRFPERDGMYFLSNQVAEYDKKRLTITEVMQLPLIITDESSAIQWLRQELADKPQTYQELHPKFTRENMGWLKHEKQLELAEILEQNFLPYDGTGDVPSQIHSYLSSNYKELRGLPKDDPALRAKAKDRWYVPDPNKAGDLEKLREKTLLREFDGYVAYQGRQLKVFRLEAVRAGFRRAWQGKNYATIIAMAEKMPQNILQEDPKLLMWYDQALVRSERD